MTFNKMKLIVEFFVAVVLFWTIVLPFILACVETLLFRGKPRRRP